MRAIGSIAIVLAILSQQGTPALEACGDKFLLVGRGVKFRQAYAAIYPASVLVFARSPQGAAKAIRDPRFLGELKQAGHHVSVVEDEQALTKALESERVDVLLTDVADAERAAARADRAPAKPKVLPVMFEPSKEEAKAIEARYQCHLTSADRSSRYLAAIDDAMKARKKKAS
jgi:hypothetical protein